MIFALWLACNSDADAIVAGLQSTNPAVREDAVRDAAEERDARVVAALIPLLTDADARIRREAAVALGTIDDPAAVPGLAAAIHDTDPAVQRAVIDALGQIGDPVAGPGLMAVVAQESPPLNAIWALGACHVDAAAPVLSGLRAHRDPWVRYNADAALRALAP